MWVGVAGSIEVVSQFRVDVVDGVLGCFAVWQYRLGDCLDYEESQIFRHAEGGVLAPSANEHREEMLICVVDLQPRGFGQELVELSGARIDLFPDVLHFDKRLSGYYLRCILDL